MYNYDSNTFMSNLYEGVYIVDKKRKIVFWNSGSEKITGYSAEEVVNTYCFHNILQHVDESGKKLCFDGCPLLDTLETGKINENFVYLQHKLGHRVPVSVKTIPLFDEFGNITAAVEVFTDSTYQKNSYDETHELKKLLELDPLTGIYNRRYLDFQLLNLVSEHNEFKIEFGILFFDIDFFKNVNDQFGHNVGDKVLITVANTIKASLRPEDYVGRWGGEEFVAVIKNVNANTLFSIAERIRMLVSNSNFHFNDQNISVTISIGGTLYQERETYEDTIARADKLMYHSKQNGRNKTSIG